jgi:uncharacterized protein GlcG (DUF336 family)
MQVLTLAQANTIANTALATARAKGYRPMAVVVVDASGHLRAAQRDDGANMFRIDVATGKAWASVAMGASSRELLKRAQDNPVFFNALAATGQGKFLPQTGAVLIKNAEGQVLGAAGASGGTGDQDEEVVALGVAEAGLVAG